METIDFGVPPLPAFRVIIIRLSEKKKVVANFLRKA
jgi:hypothetical protein